MELPSADERASSCRKSSRPLSAALAVFAETTCATFLLARKSCGEGLWNWSGAFCALQMHARARVLVFSGSMRKDRVREKGLTREEMRFVLRNEERPFD